MVLKTIMLGILGKIWLQSTWLLPEADLDYVLFVISVIDAHQNMILYSYTLKLYAQQVAVHIALKDVLGKEHLLRSLKSRMKTMIFLKMPPNLLLRFSQNIDMVVRL